MPNPLAQEQCIVTRPLVRFIAKTLLVRSVAFGTYTDIYIGTDITYFVARISGKQT